jgi:hypothetical protein
MGAAGLDPYKNAVMHGRAEMRDDILQLLSEAALVAEGRESDLLWDLIKKTRDIAVEKR